MPNRHAKKLLNVDALLTCELLDAANRLLRKVLAVNLAFFVVADSGLSAADRIRDFLLRHALPLELNHEVLNVDSFVHAY